MDPKSKVAVEQKLWATFSSYEHELDFLDAWLSLQCQMIAGAERGWLFTEQMDGAFGLIALYPDGDASADDWDVEDELSTIVGEVLSGGEGVAEPAPDPHGRGDRWLVALPLSADGRVVCATVVGLVTQDAARIASAMRQLQWGGGWVLDWLRRQRADGDGALEGATEVETETEAAGETQFDAQADAPQVDAPAAPPPPPNAVSAASPAPAPAPIRIDEGPALRLVASVLEATRYKDAAAALVGQLADIYGLERASVGLRQRGRIRIGAMSHAAYAKDRMDEVRRVEAAMDEALDQDLPIALPDHAEAPGLVTAAHRALAEAAGARGVFTAPIAAPGGAGALTVERDRPFEPDEIAAIEAAARLAGAALIEKRLNDRPLIAKAGAAARNGLAFLVGPKRPVLKAVLGAVALFLTAVALIPTTFEVRAPVALEAAQLRVVSAPFDGYLSDAPGRAGDRVAEGQLLAEFDTADLELQRSGLVADRNQTLVRLEEATAAYELAEGQAQKARLAQIEAELALVESRIARARITAPFDGVLVSGDLSQSIGEPMKLGRELFEIAPAAAYRAAVMVDERDVSYIAPGQTGRFVLASRPNHSRDLTVTRVTPVLTAEEGRNFYRVEAELSEVLESDRPGLEGRARVEAGERTILWVWTRNLVNWVRLQLWALIP